MGIALVAICGTIILVLLGLYALMATNVMEGSAALQGTVGFGTGVAGVLAFIGVLLWQIAPSDTAEDAGDAPTLTVPVAPVEEVH